MSQSQEEEGVDISDKLKCLSISQSPDDYESNVKSVNDVKGESLGDGLGDKKAIKCAEVDGREKNDMQDSTGFSKGSKFYVSGLVRSVNERGDREGDEGGDNTARGVFFLDTGAECSIISSSLVEHMDKKQISGFDLRGFTGEVGTKVTERVDLQVDLYPMRFKGSFYVCDIEISIIGADLLRDERVGISLNTGDEILTMGEAQVLTSKTPEEAMKALEERENEWENRSLIEKRWPGVKRNFWLSTKRAVTLDPSSITMVECQIEPNFRTDSKFSFLSFYDENVDKVYIPSVTFESGTKEFAVPLTNLTDKEMTIKAGWMLGEIVKHGVSGDETETRSVKIFHLDVCKIDIVMTKMSKDGVTGDLVDKKDTDNGYATNNVVKNNVKKQQNRRQQQKRQYQQSQQQHQKQQ